ncbi:MAG: hypothetical protein KJO36_03880 [Acidimicrobiia bacterium]|nr:hypothetical protein [Acidimicrobiia bacterium]NNC41816.1 Fpg/Nei family DNA glycosylase [Acidimicrobiia bacterium]NNL47222.1 Fpg/Nei family DNA glycosylase [Acidimicrobiia bacterium]
MPEGHTIHRYARKHWEALGGQAIIATSPQGRFALGAERISGRTLEAIDAFGKHLFYRWEGDETLHIHLGLFGRFRTHRSNPPPPSDATRLVLAGDDVTIYLSGPTICRLIDPDTESALRARLGPDPLLKGSHRDGSAQFHANLAQRRIPIGAALLDQKVIAGIGNVYRAEALFLAGINPHAPARDLSESTAENLWSISAGLLKRGERAGRIVTVDPADVGAKRRSDLPKTERLYVYKRQSKPCRRCGTTISMTDMGNRHIWWCESCQTST